MEPVRLRLGELLVDARIITREQLEEVLELQKSDGRRLGTLLVEQELVNETQLTQILSQQLSVPWVSLYHVDFSKRLLNLVPAQVAQKYCLVPIYVRHVRGQGDTLYVAMDDPTNLDALRECASWSGLPTRAMIASPADIRRAVEIYYGVTIGEETDQEHEASPEGEEPTTHEQEPQEQEPQESDSAETPDAEEPAPAPAPDEEPKRDVEAPAPESGEGPDVDGDEARAGADEHAEPKASQPPPAAEPLNRGTLEPEAQEQAAAHRESIHVVSVDEDAAPVVEVDEQLADESKQDSEAREEQDDVRVEVGEELTLEELLAQRGKTPDASEGPEQSPYKRSKSGKMLSLTLLDGTTLALPVQRKAAKKRSRDSLVGSMKAEGGAPSVTALPPREVVDEHLAGKDGLTVRDILAALRAASHGVDSSETLGRHARWEAMMAALLAILVRKGLITEEELLDEMRKI